LSGLYGSYTSPIFAQPQPQAPTLPAQAPGAAAPIFAQPPPQSNFAAAHAALNLTPQEQALYQRHLTNLNGPGGVDNPPDAQNPQGSRSTLYQAVQEHNGQFYSIPTVWDGKREVEPYTRPDGSVMDVPNQTALDKVAKTGWDQFPAYSTPDEADARYAQMHDYIDKDTADYMANKQGAQQ
jgi:hypothetical protein